MVREDEDDELTSTQTQQDGKDINETLYEFIHKRQDIHVKVLMYEPLDIEWIKKEIKDAGIKCSMEKLLNFLDQKVSSILCFHYSTIVLNI